MHSMHSMHGTHGMQRTYSMHSATDLSSTAR
jgi:hypothetical protein